MMFAKTSTLKANAVDPATSLTLMSADIERITNGWQTMHEIWANLIEVTLAIYLLERQLGAACAIPLAVAICKSISQYLNTRHSYALPSKSKIYNNLTNHYFVVCSFILSFGLRPELGGTKASPLARGG